MTLGSNMSPEESESAVLDSFAPDAPLRRADMQ